MSDERTVISGTRRSIRELVDGTIRVQIDIDQQHAKDFHRLFPNIDMPVALAPLNPAALRDDPDLEPEHEPEPEPRKGWSNLGSLAQSAVMVCKSLDFRQYMANKFGNPKDPPSEEVAANFVRTTCGVKSRKELDTDKRAAHAFRIMMGQYSKWLHEQARPHGE